MKKYDHDVKKKVYNHIVDATNDAMKGYDPKPKAGSVNFWDKFNYRGKLGGAFHSERYEGAYVKKRGSGYEIGAKINAAQAAILDSKGFKLRARTQSKKGLIHKGVHKEQQFDFDKAVSKVDSARRKVPQVIDSVKQK